MAMNSRLIQRARELQHRPLCYARTVQDTVLLAEPENEAVWRLRLEVSEAAVDREEALRALLRLQPDGARASGARVS